MKNNKGIKYMLSTVFLLLYFHMQLKCKECLLEFADFFSVSIVLWSLGKLDDW